MTEDFELDGNKNPKIISPDGEKIKMYHSKSDLEDEDEFHAFIKATENCVRTDPRYDNYICNLKSLGYNRDVIQGGIDNEKYPNTAIEMHHGPLSLYDVCAIVTDHLLAEKEKVSTFKVANIVLREHELGHVNVVMGLTKTNHELYHSGKVFIHMNQTLGDIMPFIEKYHKGFHKEHVYSFTQYLHMCMEHDATDNDYLAIKPLAEKINRLTKQ